MPRNFTTNVSIFPPKTEEIQLDEKWSFVRKKQRNRRDKSVPVDAGSGDCWDHVALDAEHRLVLQVVCGKQTYKNTLLLLRKTAKRLKNRVPRLITSDEREAYKKAVLLAFGEKHQPEHNGKRGRPRAATYHPGPDLVYAMVRKTRTKGRVTNIRLQTVFGSDAQVQSALAASSCSRKINTAFIERQNSTDRNRCSRKIRQSYCFSKSWDTHLAATYFTLYTYNFCWPVRTLRRPDNPPAHAPPPCRRVWPTTSGR